MFEYLGAKTFFGYTAYKIIINLCLIQISIYHKIKDNSENTILKDNITFKLICYNIQ